MERSFWLLVLFFPFLAAGQTASLQGRVTNQRNEPLEMARVILKPVNLSTYTDSQGEYQFKEVPFGTYEVLAFSYEYQAQKQVIELSANDQRLDFQLVPLEVTLSEVTVSSKEVNNFGIRRLRSVEGMAIYEGKKTEVVEMKHLVANKAANNARQTFAKMAGANIWESDCAGIQLGIGARGLSPNRTANFNTRQNGYDISADAIGYPESYYTPPLEALDRIEIVRGAASLQYGSQFGGMLNFRMKRGNEDETFRISSRQTIGSYGFWNAFNSVGGQAGKVNYYAFYQRKEGDCWRCNSEFDLNMVYGAAEVELTEKLTIKMGYTFMDYLTRQAGGLTQRMFEEDPQQSVRPRNWFKVKWNLPSVTLEYKFSPQTELEIRSFGMFSSREALGNLDRINKIDELVENRTLIRDDYQNVGAETRFLHRYSLGKGNSVFLAGVRVYQGTTFQQQGLANGTSQPDFYFLNPEEPENLDYQYPNRNVAVFAENVFSVSPKLSITPGVRFEHIKTTSEGYFRNEVRDAAGNIVYSNKQEVNQLRERSFFLLGMGLNYQLSDQTELYGNFSQNYRAVTFNDMRVANPNFTIDPDLQDEKGYNADVGFRGRGSFFYVDASLFYLRYNQKIGMVLKADQPPLFLDYRFRTNVADSRTFGLEVVGEVDLVKAFDLPFKESSITIFNSLTLNNARYINSEDTSIEGKKIELVPPVVLRAGLTYSKKQFRSSLQYSYVGEQFTDATNADNLYTASAVIGPIPAYQVWDFSASYQWKNFELEASVNNLLNNSYFTRRATGYPGPGIIPAEGRTFFLTVGYSFAR